MEEFIQKFDNIKLKLIKKGRIAKLQYAIPVIFLILFEIKYLHSLYVNAELIERNEFILGSIFFPIIILFGFIRIPALKFVPGNIIRKIYVQFKSVIILHLFRENKIRAKYFPNTAISKDKFVRSLLFNQKIIRYSGSDGFSGITNGKHFQISEIHVKSNFISIFNGFFIELKLSNVIGIKPNTLVLPENLITKKHTQDFPIEIENVYFEYGKNYKIISTHKNISQQNRLIKMLSEFIEKTNKDVYISFSSSVIYIGISINDYIFELDLSQKKNDVGRLKEHIRIFNATMSLVKEFSALYQKDIAR